MSALTMSRSKLWLAGRVGSGGDPGNRNLYPAAGCQGD